MIEKPPIPKKLKKLCGGKAIASRSRWGKDEGRKVVKRTVTGGRQDDYRNRIADF